MIFHLYPQLLNKFCGINNVTLTQERVIEQNNSEINLIIYKNVICDKESITRKGNIV